MPVLIRAVDDRLEGKVYLRFPYDKPTIEQIKTIPGCKWDRDLRQWVTSEHGLAALESIGLKCVRTIQSELRATIPDLIATRLRPYQVEAAEFAIRRAGALLTMDPRTGKTPTAIAWMTALMSARHADMALIFYPASVREEWERQLDQWARVGIYAIEGNSQLDQGTIDALRSEPFQVVGCHWEILDKHADDLHAIVAGRRFLVIGDEVHACKNRKAGRTIVAKSLASARGAVTLGSEAKDDLREVESGFCVGRLGLTGTPMRNRSRDLFGVIDFVAPESMGGYWTFAKRYCDAQVNDRGHWEDKGEANSDELALRLNAISYRKTRREVAQWLPKSQRSVIACQMPEKELKKYRKLERATATAVAGGLDDSDPTMHDRQALETLAKATATGKIPTAIERIYLHAERGTKTLVFANFHETLEMMDEALIKETTERYNDGDVWVPHFVAGGWMTPDKRRKVIETWKTTPGPAALLVNTIASGVGIDLSDAETAIFLELTWVPADFVQAEARIQDIHLGKRTTPPLYEYLIVKDTIDESMAATLLDKVRAIEAVVGEDAETGGVATTLRGSGVIGSNKFGLPATDRETVKAVLAGLRAKLLGNRAAITDTTESLAADAAEVFEDEGGESTDEAYV